MRTLDQIIEENSAAHLAARDRQRALQRLERDELRSSEAARAEVERKTLGGLAQADWGRALALVVAREVALVPTYYARELCLFIHRTGKADWRILAPGVRWIELPTTIRPPPGIRSSEAWNHPSMALSTKFCEHRFLIHGREVSAMVEEGWKP